MRIVQSLCRATLLILCVSLISACALLKKPIPLTQLQLALDAQQISWPSSVSLGGVQSRAVLKTDRIIVMRGALVMQHEGLRWTSAPEILLAEQLGILGMVNSGSNSARVDRPQQRELTVSPRLSNSARIDVWLNEFNVAVLQDGTSSATVSVAATINCPSAPTAEPTIKKLPLVRATLPLNSTDPQRVATRFNEAATMVFNQLLNTAAASCRTR
jgi:hypothetical protein